MLIILIGIAAGCATFIGGSLALKFKDHIHLILGFSAGAVIGVALFDLLPEAIATGASDFSATAITSLVALGFVLYLMLDRMIIFTTEDNGHRGHVGAGSLTVHSFLDGIGIGLAFQVSVAVGAILAVAVLIHDFSDGVNTVNLSLLGGGGSETARGWLIADALAPLLGIGATFLFRLPEAYLGLILALFAGFFLYIGAAELLPESHHRYPTFWTSAITVLGVIVIYFAVHFAS